MAHMLIISTSSLVVSLCVFVGSELELFNCLAIGSVDTIYAYIEVSDD